MATDKWFSLTNVFSFLAHVPFCQNTQQILLSYSLNACSILQYAKLMLVFFIVGRNRCKSLQ